MGDIKPIAASSENITETIRHEKAVALYLGYMYAKSWPEKIVYNK